MSNKEFDKIVSFLFKYMVSNDDKIFINPDINIPDNDFGFNFIKNDNIQGIAILSPKTPFLGMDMHVKDLVNAIDYMSSVKSFGVLVGMMDSGTHIYLDSDTRDYKYIEE